MPQTPINKEYNTFVKGFITEAGPFTFPENASLSEDNFDLNVKGYRSIRKGIDYENGFSQINTNSLTNVVEAEAISSFLWEDVNTKGELTILVVQVGFKLFFFDANKQPVSSAQLNQGEFLEVDSDPSFIFQATSISGNLIIATNANKVYQLVYDEGTDKVSYLVHGLLVRDIWSISDNYTTDYRYTSADDDSDEREYNLANNGWNRLSPENNSESSQVTYQDEFRVDYNSRFGVLRNPNLIDKVVEGIDSADQNKFKGQLLLNNNSSSSLSPKGSHVIDVFRRGDSRQYAFYRKDILSNYGAIFDWQEENEEGNKSLGDFDYSSTAVPLSTVVSPSFQLNLRRDKTPGGVKCVTSYAGRVFYAGFESTVEDGDVKSPILGTYVLFSQVVDNAEKVGKCYQEGDPTSLNDFDLVANDGGAIKIPGAARILRLVPVGRSLVVVASNGVWEIRGSEGSFSAVDFTVEKVSDIGAISATSIVVAENKIYYWSTGGIYAIEREQTGLTLLYKNITSDTIQSYFNDIGAVQKETAKGVYSESSKTISWLYNDEEDYTSVADKFRYNRQLNLNLVLGAFYTYTFDIGLEDTEYPRVADIYISPTFITSSYEEAVIIGSNVVQVEGIDDVVISRSSSSNTLSEISYLAVKPKGDTAWTFTVAALNNPGFVDWGRDESEGLEYVGHLEAGHDLIIDEDSQRQKQIQYITTHLERTEDGFDSELSSTSKSSCFMQARWDFGNSLNSGKLGQKQQIYRLRRDYIPSGTGDEFDYGQSVITTKNKVRGRGKALSLRFETEPGKDCILYGWGALYAANSNV